MKDRINRGIRTFCYVLGYFTLGILVDSTVFMPILLAVCATAIHFGISSGIPILAVAIFTSFFFKELVYRKVPKLGNFRKSLSQKILDRLDDKIE